MNCLLPNTTAEAVGFTIPGRSSSLRRKSKPTSNHTKRKKKSSLDKSRNEVAERMRSLSLESQEAQIRKGVIFDSAALSHRQILKRATSTASTSSSSNAPISLYRNPRPPSQNTGDLSRQNSLKIKTFRTTNMPDPHNSPDLSAHPANSLPGSPIGLQSESPTIPSLENYSSERPSAPPIKSTSEPPSNGLPQPSPHTSFLLSHTEDTTDETNYAPAVTHETVHHHTENIILEQITRDIHSHHFYNYIQPIKETVYAPAQHYATGIEGKVIKIPDALGESLEMVKEAEPKRGVASMGWE